MPKKNIKKLKARDKRIIKLFHQKHHVKRRRYDDCLEELSEEFTLEASTIERILKGNYNYKTKEDESI